MNTAINETLAGDRASRIIGNDECRRGAIKLPPYGRQISRNPVAREIRVYFGDSPQAWDHTRARQKYGPAVLLPAGEDFAIYRWDVNKREVLMLQIGNYVTEDIPDFARMLLMAGAVIVRVLHPDGLAAFRPQRRAAA